MTDALALLKVSWAIIAQLLNFLVYWLVTLFTILFSQLKAWRDSCDHKFFLPSCSLVTRIRIQYIPYQGRENQMYCTIHTPFLQNCYVSHIFINLESTQTIFTQVTPWRPPLVRVSRVYVYHSLCHLLHILYSKWHLQSSPCGFGNIQKSGVWPVGRVWDSLGTWWPFVTFEVP